MNYWDYQDINLKFIQLVVSLNQVLHCCLRNKDNADILTLSQVSRIPRFWSWIKTKIKMKFRGIMSDHYIENIVWLMIQMKGKNLNSRIKKSRNLYLGGHFKPPEAIWGHLWRSEAIWGLFRFWGQFMILRSY